MRISRRLALTLPAAAAALAARPSQAEPPALRGTGDLGVVVERASGSLLIVETTGRSILGRVEGLGDLSHATVVFSRDQRYAYVFGRDGGLSKVDILRNRIDNRVVQGGNAIGGAISDDGKLIAVSNYQPGGVRIFDARSLERLHDLPAIAADGAVSKTVGLVDLPGRRFMVSLYDAGEIWLIDCSADAPQLVKLGRAGALPYDGYVTADGRHYLAGLFGEDGVAHVDLWRTPLKIERILDGYGKGEQKLPVYKMPHLEGWGQTGSELVLPAVGRHEVIFVDIRTLTEAGRTRVHGQPVFCVMRPDGRQAWVNFALPHNDAVQVIDLPSRSVVHEMRPGPAILHLEFTPRGEELWLSLRDADRIAVFDTRTFEKRAELPARSPSGIFFTSRANRIGL